MRRKSLLIILIVIIAFCICNIQNYLSVKTARQWKTESFSYLPGNESISGFLLGYETTLSHYLWIRTVIYFGSHYKTDRQYTWIVNMIDIITKLNPYFYPAYEFAGVVLPDITKRPDLSRIILERGIANVKTKQWNLAFYMGILQYQYYNDPYMAAFYFDLASRAPGAPVRKLVGLAALLYNRAGLENYALEYLRMMYETTDNPEVKRHIFEKIDKLINDGKVRQTGNNQSDVK